MGAGSGCGVLLESRAPSGTQPAGQLRSTLPGAAGGQGCPTWLAATCSLSFSSSFIL